VDMLTCNSIFATKSVFSTSQNTGVALILLEMWSLFYIVKTFF